MSRTLCPLEAEHRKQKPQIAQFLVDISSASKTPTGYTLQTEFVKDFDLE